METALEKVTPETDLVSVAPSQVTNYLECERAVGWLRIKNQFDAAVDAAHKEAISLAHKAHKAAIKVAADLKKPSDGLKDRVRELVRSYAGNPSSELPDGVFRRRSYKITVTNPEEVPVMYRTPDMKLIEAFVKRTEGSILIPGVTVETTTDITVRSEEDNG